MRSAGECDMPERVRPGVAELLRIVSGADAERVKNAYDCTRQMRHPSLKKAPPKQKA
jgi:hypothetical protein